MFATADELGNVPLFQLPGSVNENVPDADLVQIAAAWTRNENVHHAIAITSIGLVLFIRSKLHRVFEHKYYCIKGRKILV